MSDYIEEDGVAGHKPAIAGGSEDVIPRDPTPEPHMD
jgi:hypothetical protein